MNIQDVFSPGFIYEVETSFTPLNGGRWSIPLSDDPMEFLPIFRAFEDAERWRNQRPNQRRVFVRFEEPDTLAIYGIEDLTKPVDPFE